VLVPRLAGCAPACRCGFTRVRIRLGRPRSSRAGTAFAVGASPPPPSICEAHMGRRRRPGVSGGGPTYPIPSLVWTGVGRGPPVPDAAGNARCRSMSCPPVAVGSAGGRRLLTSAVSSMTVSAGSLGRRRLLGGVTTAGDEPDRGVDRWLRPRRGALAAGPLSWRLRLPCGSDFRKASTSLGLGSECGCDSEPAPRG
jgi:hypothetical protein